LYVLFFLYRQKANNQKKKLVAKYYPGHAYAIAGPRCASRWRRACLNSGFGQPSNMQTSF